MIILPDYDHSTTARRVFSEVVLGANFMTPNHIKTIRVGDYAIELCKGEGFKRETIYGFTVVNMLTRTRENDLSCCCHSINDVEEALEAVK